MVTMDALRRSFQCCWMDCSCNAISILTTTASRELARDGSCGARSGGGGGPEGGRAAWVRGRLQALEPPQLEVDNQSLCGSSPAPSPWWAQEVSCKCFRNEHVREREKEEPALKLASSEVQRPWFEESPPTPGFRLPLPGSSQFLFPLEEKTLPHTNRGKVQLLSSHVICTQMGSSATKA